MKKSKKIEKKIVELKKELEEKETSNRLAYDMYGSELCAGGMLSEERKLREEIDLLGKILEMPGVDESDRNIKKRMSLAREEINNIQKQQEQLENKRKEWEKSLNLLKKIYEV